MSDYRLIGIAQHAIIAFGDDPSALDPTSWSNEDVKKAMCIAQQLYAEEMGWTNGKAR